MWYQSLTAKLQGKQLVNDSKTPSGQVHVGSLRGVLIHDALYRSLKKNDKVEAKFIYGIDDYDPMDGLPADASESLRQHMGKPLCHVPAPNGSQATDLADHYTAEFLGIFAELGVDASVYRTRDLYSQGKFNSAIETILDNAEVVRQIYKEVSGSEKPDNWYPFQVICQSCGKVGTTQVYDYKDGLVSYHCSPDMVSWAQGCGHKGTVSPLNGSGKLPWKLEWVAKWATLGITVEGSGKDHCTKGGSHDVAVRCLQRIFRKKPPLNIPYEFFLVSGAKMSSSKGIGSSARDMADFLPPAVLRFLMIRTPPKRTVNFSTDQEYIVKLFNEYDQLMSKDASDNEDIASMQAMVQPANNQACLQPVSFQLITALLQLPNKDVIGQVSTRYQLTELQKQDLEKRIESATYWLEYFVKESDRVTLQEKMPNSAEQLSDSQRALLFILAHSLSAESFQDTQDENYYQQLIFDTSRLIPIDSKLSFAALYCVLLDTTQGPKGGSLLAYIDHEFLYKRFTELQPTIENLLNKSNVSGQELIAWLDKNKQKLASTTLTSLKWQKTNILQLYITLDNERKHIFRTPDHQLVKAWLQNNQTQITQQEDIQLSSWNDNWRQLTHIG